MTAPLSSQSESVINAASTLKDVSQEQSITSIQPSVGQPVILPVPPPQEPSAFYTFEDEEPDLMATPFVAPFQLSNALPTPIPSQAKPLSESQDLSSPPLVATRKQRNRPRLSLMMVAILVCVVVIGGMFLLNAFAQATPPLQTGNTATAKNNQQPKATQAPSKNTGMQNQGNQQNQSQGQTTMPTPTPTQSTTTGTGTNGQGQPAQTAPDWVPPRLPDGWITAGLQMEDGIEALRTAVAFNDREMSLDYRSVGTRNAHGGTFTAAMFILTPAAKQRFGRNDIRMINNTLFDKVAQQRLVRLVVNPQPLLVKFTQQGQQQFAWIDVSFQLWQSEIDPQNPTQRIAGKELDPATNQPRIHHMIVLLLRVPPQNAGANPAMGGTGWLVSTYSLNPANGTLPDIIQPA